MACGCSEVCSCYLESTDTVSITGAGTSVSPYQATVIPDPTGGLENTANGVAVLIDPASTLPWSLGVDGLLLDCCPAEVVDSESINFDLVDGAITGDVILDPDGGLEEVAGAGLALLIDPASTVPWSLGPDGLLLDCCEEGVAPEIITFTSDGLFEKGDYPAATYIRVRCVGAGGGGGGTAAIIAGESACAGGGGGGGYSEEILATAALGASVAVTVGEAAPPAGPGANNGSAGEASSFGAFLSATGGGGGEGDAGGSGAGTSNGGAGGAGAGGSFNLEGDDGGIGSRGGADRYSVGYGGGSQLAGRTIDNNAAPTAGKVYGGGGKGASANGVTADQGGGAGADGIVIVEIIK